MSDVTFALGVCFALIAREYIECAALTLLVLEQKIGGVSTCMEFLAGNCYYCEVLSNDLLLAMLVLRTRTHVRTSRIPVFFS